MDAARRSLYLHDFETRIKDVDTCVSVKAGNTPSLIFIYEVRPDSAGGYHVQDLASYYPKLKVPAVNVPPTPKKAGNLAHYFSAYVIHAPAVTAFVERALEHPSLAGFGDRAISEFWMIIAVSLVRLRVLAHKELFPGMKLRTKEDMVKHRLMFTEHNDEIEGLRNIESQYTRLSPGDRKDPHNVDTFWTLQLVARSLESGATFEDALNYITLG